LLGEKLGDRLGLFDGEPLGLTEGPLLGEEVGPLVSAAVLIEHTYEDGQ
jgi:hypothetical protein